MKVTLFILKIMSTFGKKHITYWNYEPTGDINDINGLYLGFQKSPKEVQLKILEKWYPIGEVCKIKNNPLKFRITGYVEFYEYSNIHCVQNCWLVKLEYTDVHKVEDIKGPTYYVQKLIEDKIKNPLDIKFDEETVKKIRRDIKLKSLFGI